MRQFSVLLSLSCLLYFSCGQSEKKAALPVVQLHDTIKLVMHDTLPMPLDSTQELDLPWADSLVWKYIESANDPFIKATKKSKPGIAFIYDGPEKRDSATYLVYKLGDNFESHFATTQWVYIDSNTRVIYNYDLANDSLIKWRN
jgi:hypothetical protein